MLALGIDGCRAGWIAAWIDAGRMRGFTVVRHVEQLPRLDDAMVFIDIPIGLPDSGDRECDVAARKQLGAAWPRVFIGLRRPLLRFKDYDAAKAWAKSDGKGLAIQAFCILSKVAEIDGAMSPARQERVRESHPELVFQRLNGGTPLDSKKKPHGLRARRGLLERHGFTEVACWLERLRGTGAKPDDLYDACALALAAEDAIAGRARRVDCAMAADAKGLRMEMWY